MMQPPRRTWPLAAIVAAALALPHAAVAEIKVGVTIAATGTAAALGVPARNTFTELFPKEIAGEKITVILLDDASDPGQATTNARRLATEDKVDVLVGSSITPSSMAWPAWRWRTACRTSRSRPSDCRPGEGSGRS
jgi:branched-chain amino acid transport system substrate-binding protein